MKSMNPHPFCLATILLLSFHASVPVLSQGQESAPATDANPSNIETFDSRYNQIVEIREQGDPVEALRKLEQLLADLQQASQANPDSAEVKIDLLFSQALEANLLRDLNRADESIEKQAKLLEQTAGQDTLDVQLLRSEVRQNYALSLNQAGKPKEAIEQIRQTIEEYDRLQQQHPENKRIVSLSTTASNNLGTLLVSNGRYREAMEVFNDAIDLLRNHPDRKESQRQLALLLLNNAMATATVGDSIEARRLIEEAIDLKEILGEGDTQEAIRARITLGAILGRLNQYNESAEVYRLVVEKLRTLYPKDKYPDGTVDLAIVLDNRSVSLSRLKQFEAAIPLAEEANQMFAALAKKAPALRVNLARSNASLALLNARAKRYPVAIRNLTAAIHDYEELYPDGHTDMPGLYRSKSIILSEMRRSDEAIEAATKSLELARTQFPANNYPDGHWILAQSLDSTGLIYLAVGQPKEAANYFAQALAMQNNLARQALRYISEAESLQFLAIADTFQSHLLSVPGDAKETYQLLCNAKGRILDQQKQRFQTARRSQNPTITQLYQEYEKIRTTLAALLLKPTANQESAQFLKQLQLAREDLERKIAEASQGKSDHEYEDIEGVRIHQVIDQLETGTTTIEFFSYEHFSINDEAEHRRTEGEQRICAFVIDSGSRDVRRLDFGQALPLRQTVRRLVAAMQFGTEQQPLNELSESLCDPLVKALPANCQRLFIIPDDAISGIPFACLKNSATGNLLVQQLEISILTSLGAFASESPKLTTTSKVVGVGSIDYGTVREKESIQFYSLPGTRTELSDLANRIDKSYWTELSGQGVTPEILISTIETADLIHLATHAYVSNFVRSAVTNNSLDSGAIRDTATERNPLLATRIALSGANDPDANAVVTGDRLVSANLDQAELVVLSACESGVGERVLGEGVFGLQRAFHVAGAKHVIATLWPVSDTEAVRFMEFFYEGLLEQELPAPQALRQAQLRMLNSPSSNQPSGSRLVVRGIKFNLPSDTSTENPDSDATARSDASINGSSRSTWGAFFLSVD